MEKKQVICPNCGSRLSFMVQPDMENKVLACPICKNKDKVSEYIRHTNQANHDEKPPILPPNGPCDNRLISVGDPDTQPVNPGEINHDPGQLHILHNNQYCPLRRGQQIVGRWATSKKADVQIGNETDKDNYMSRHHIDIIIQRGLNGSLQHLIREHIDPETGKGPGNGTFINGTPMREKQITILHFGDKITLGRTEIVLEKTDEEATRAIL